MKRIYELMLFLSLCVTLGFGLGVSLLAIYAATMGEYLEEWE